jgi:hypothetical protein
MEIILEYLDKHQHLIPLVICFVGILVAWASGLFNLIKGLADKLDNRLRVEIAPVSARICILREFDHQGQPAQRFAIWLCVELRNPSERLAAVASFEMVYNTKSERWSPPLHPVTFPSLPTQELGSNVKLLPVFFSTFPAAKRILGEEIGRDGKVQPGEFQVGYLLFIEECFGDFLPQVTSKGLLLKLSCKDLKGRKTNVKTYARSISANAANQFIPGLSVYAEGDKARSFLHRWESTFDPNSEEGKKVQEQMEKNP